MCCSTEDDADNPKINWNENLLSMQNLQVRQQEINNQVTLTFVAVNNEFEGKVGNRGIREGGKGGLGKKNKEVLGSLGVLSRATKMNVLEVLENLEKYQV